MLKTIVMVNLVILILLFAGCSGFQEKSSIQFKKEHNQSFSFRNAQIQLNYDSKMQETVYQPAQGVSLTKSDSGRPSHFIVVNGEEITDFEMDPAQTQILEVQNQFGKGKQLILKV